MMFKFGKKMGSCMNKSAIALAVALSAVAVNATAGEGTVHFQGKVIEAPCGITQETANQTIDFGLISKSHLASGGTSDARPVLINLVNCDVTNVKKGVAVNFTGSTVTGTANELETAGPANTAIVINGYGKDINYNNPTELINITKGDNTLRFTSWVKQATGKQVAEGDFKATANFSMTYE
ncbi:fimbrial protein [Vagococcus sp. WN89Y]|uniref:fimbrial protein n=1 Tax=Vagococcus sp. WN89Y TaxID=3457258 RepID=UPI003FCEE1B9